MPSEKQNIWASSKEPDKIMASPPLDQPPQLENEQVPFPAVIHNLDQFPHRKLVGRSWELNDLKKFLIPPANVSEEQSHPIMIVTGLRGIGKSTLVREAAWFAVQSKQFKAVLWFHRERFIDFLLGSHEELPLPNTPNNVPPWDKLDEFLKSDSHEYIRSIHQKAGFRDEIERKGYFTFFQNFLSAHTPFLIIVDDFDETDKLDSTKLCKELERVHSPNKIILTSRLLDNSFSDGIFKTLELGLLGIDEVRLLVENDFCNLPSHKLPEEGLYKAADLIWKWSGGLPIFITKCIEPNLQKGGWKLEDNKQWAKVCDDYAAEYCSIDLNALSDIQKYVLLNLSLHEHLQNLKERELALSIGICPDDKDEIGEFYNVLHSLHCMGLVGIRNEQERGKKGRVLLASVCKWTILPFTRNYVTTQLEGFSKTGFYPLLAEHWTRLLEFYGNASLQVVESYIELAYSAFRWCFEQEDWTRTISLGQRLSEVMWEANYQGSQDPKRRFYFDEVSKGLVDGYQHQSDWWGMVNQLTQLAYFYLNSDEIQKAAYASKQAIEILNKAQENGKANSTHWATTAYVYAKSQSALGNSESAQTWFGKAIDAYTSLNDLEGEAQASIELAKEYLAHDQYDNAIELAMQAKKNAMIASAFKLAAEASTISAEITRIRGDIRKFFEITKDSIKIARSGELYSTEQDLKKRLEIYGQESESDAEMPILQIIEEIFRAKVEWGDGQPKDVPPPPSPEEQQRCPVCRNSLPREEDGIACPQCGTMYHYKCWEMLNQSCRICELTSS